MVSRRFQTLRHSPGMSPSPGPSNLECLIGSSPRLDPFSPSDKHLQPHTFTRTHTHAHTQTQDLRRHALSLAHPKVRLLLKTPNTKALAPEHRFRFNWAYTNPLRRVRIPLLSAKAVAQAGDSLAGRGRGGGAGGDGGSKGAPGEPGEAAAEVGWSAAGGPVRWGDGAGVRLFDRFATLGGLEWVVLVWRRRGAWAGLLLRIGPTVCSFLRNPDDCVCLCLFVIWTWRSLFFLFPLTSLMRFTVVIS